jgi:putative ABC transport system ATP-binding protein
LEVNRSRGTTLVLVTHDPELAARAQRNVHIVDGMATDLSVEPSLLRVAASSLAEAKF